MVTMVTENLCRICYILHLRRRAEKTLGYQCIVPQILGFIYCRFDGRDS
jgi:hypothetical protein